jgi:hypothetical protein
MTRIALLFTLIVSFLSWSGDAQAYPGSAVSVGSNPVRSAAGVRNLGSGLTVAEVIAAPPDQDLILTDVLLGCAVQYEGAYYSAFVKLLGSDGTTYGAYVLQGSRLYDSGVMSTHNLTGLTGIRIPAGVSVSLEWSFTYQTYPDERHTFTYTLGGYLAAP